MVGETRERVVRDAGAAGIARDGARLNDGGVGADAYADAVATYLAFAVDRGADYWSTIATWVSGGEFVRDTFARQAIAMSWDYAEARAAGGRIWQLARGNRMDCPGNRDRSGVAGCLSETA